MDLIEQLQNDLPLSKHEILILLLTAAHRYKLHYIEKRHGRGQRLIAQPTAEVKVLQRWAVARYVNLLPVHQSATAYRPGASIRDHAAMHARNSYLLKLDFEDFFPSLKGKDFFDHARSNLDISDRDADFLVRLLFRYDRVSKDYILSIGAPSSPAVSNTLMYEFDMKLNDYCIDHGIIYSRYADDLALSTSGPKKLDEAYQVVKQLCNDLAYPRLSLNHNKTVFTSKKFRRQLTGLVLTNEGKPSIGREKKRLIRSMAHHYSSGDLAPDQVSRLRGLLAFAYSVEPAFVETISKMVGTTAFSELMRGQ